jgi:hypothetical protein
MQERDVILKLDEVSTTKELVWRRCNGKYAIWGLKDVDKECSWDMFDLNGARNRERKAKTAAACGHDEARKDDDDNAQVDFDKAEFEALHGMMSSKALVFQIESLGKAKWRKVVAVYPVADCTSEQLNDYFWVVVERLLDTCRLTVRCCVLDGACANRLLVKSNTSASKATGQKDSSNVFQRAWVVNHLTLGERCATHFHK